MNSKISKIIKRINALDSCYVMDVVPCIDYVHEKIREYGLNVFNSGSKITEKLVPTPPSIELWEYWLLNLCCNVFAVRGYSTGHLDFEKGKYKTLYCFYGNEGKPEIAAKFYTVMYKFIRKAQRNYALGLGSIKSRDTKNYRLSQYCRGMVDVLEGYAKKLPISEAEQQELDNHNKKIYLGAHLNTWPQFKSTDELSEQAKADYLAGQSKAKGAVFNKSAESDQLK